MSQQLSSVAARAASLLFALTLTTAPTAQELHAQQTDSGSVFSPLQWRNIGPFRGGRSVAATGVRGQPDLYYVGYTGGGVWKTEDRGLTWRNITDGQLKTGSVGAITVAPSDPNVIYVGMGEHAVRGVTTSAGDGVYRSTDAGKTWQHLGLEKTQVISAIQVHPKDPDLVYVAAQGNTHGPNPERGIYRSRDGGKTWSLIHTVSDSAGASDLSMDPHNPRILYAGYWQHVRLPWQVRSGGAGSGLWKSTDGGDTWKKLDKGLPKVMGKTAIAVSPVDGNTVWAMIEAEDGGLFRSDDAGATWRLTTANRLIRARAWYYIEVVPDTKDLETAYVLNAPLTRSIDGGKTFASLDIPHGDTHGLWINPDDSRLMILADDGGGTITSNAGQTWSSQENQPTAQFYRVNTDHRFPYWVYGGQQDNNSVATPSANFNAPGIGWKDWFDAAGCESAYLAFNRDDPRYLYGGCYQGIISEMDTRNGTQRDIMAYPTQGLASIPGEQKYRFNWNAPIVASDHNPSVLYHGANVVLRSTDRGNTWTPISPDLTRNEKAKQGPGGAPITNEGAGGEVYNTIFTIAESPKQAGLIWVGTDDGLIHLTRDGGSTWESVTPKGLPESLINSIEASPHDPATAYAAVSRYKFNDQTPHIYRTTDYGKSWTHLVNGIGPEAWVRVVREDPIRKGLLYAGTERGFYLSFDGGQQWKPLQFNLPVVAITDLQINGNDLVASTQGRAFWVLDDVTLLRELTPGTTPGVAVYSSGSAPRVAAGGGFSPSVPGFAANPPGGAQLYLHLPQAPDSAMRARLEILDASGKPIRTFVTRREKDASGKPVPADSIALSKGMNRVAWDFRHQGFEGVAGLFTLGGTQGRLVAPGRYTVQLTVGEASATINLEVRPDPRFTHPAQAYVAQEQMAATLQGQLADLFDSVRKLRAAREQMKAAVTRAEGTSGHSELKAAADSLEKRMQEAEERLVQPKSTTFQDVVNFTSKLDAQLLQLMGTVDGAEPPLTAGQRERFADLSRLWGGEKGQVDQLLGAALSAFNEMVQRLGVPAVVPSGQ